MWLAHLCGFGKGGDSCSLPRDVHPGLVLSDLIRRPHLYEERKGGPAPKTLVFLVPRGRKEFQWQNCRSDWTSSRSHLSLGLLHTMRRAKQSKRCIAPQLSSRLRELNSEP